MAADPGASPARRWRSHGCVPAWLQVVNEAIPDNELHITVHGVKGLHNGGGRSVYVKLSFPYDPESKTNQEAKSGACDIRVCEGLGSALASVQARTQLVCGPEQRHCVCTVYPPQAAARAVPT